MVLLCETGVGILGRKDELSFVRAGGARWRVEVGGFCSALATAAGVVVAGVGDQGRLVWLDTYGSVISEWQPLGSRISALAVAHDGRVAVGTYDETLEVGDMAGPFASGVELEHVPPVDADLWFPCTRGVGFLADGAIVAIAGTGHVHVLGPDLDPRVHVQHDTLAFEDTVDILELGGGRFLAASDRLSLVVEPDGRVDAPIHGFTARSRNGLAYLREGRLFLLGPDGRIRCEHDAPPGARALDLDDGVLVVGCSDGAVHWLDPDSGITLDARQILATAVVELVAYGDLLAVCGDGDQLVVAGAERAWPQPLEARALEPARLLDLGNLRDARWSEDGSAIVVRGEPLRVHAADDGRELASWPGEQPMGLWSAHGSYIAYHRHHIDVYDAATLARRDGGPVPPDNLSLRAVLLCGTLLASVAGMIVVAPDGTLHSIDTGARLRDGLLCHHGNHGPVGRGDTRAAVAPTDRRGILLSLPDGVWLAELDAVNGVWAFSPDGERLIEARSGALYDASDGGALGTCGGGGSGAAAWARGGAAIVRCEPDGAWWYAADGRRLHAVPGASGGHPYVSPGGTHVVVVRGARLLCLDGRDGQVRGELELATSAGLVLEFVGEDRVLAVPNAIAPADPTVWLLDPGACCVVAPLALNTDDRLHWACPLRWGERVVLAPVRGRVHAFELADGALVGTLDLGAAELRALDVSVRGELLVASSDGRVRVL